MDRERIRSIVKRAGEAGKEAFDTLMAFQDAVTLATGNRQAAESFAIDAATDILVSAVANSINSGSGNGEEEGEKVAKSLRARIRELLKDFFLENGAEIAIIDLKPNEEEEEHEEEEHEDQEDGPSE